MPVPRFFYSRAFLAGVGIVGLGIYANITAPPEQSRPAKAPARAKATGPSEMERRIYAERQILARLRDPDSASFSDVRVSYHSGTAVVCGSVNSKNGLGGMAGPQRFISGNVTALEEDMAEGEMAKIWGQMC